MGVAWRATTTLTLPSPANGRGFSPLDPHVGEARDAERLETLHVRARRLDLGERAERYGVDALKDDLLHPRERRLPCRLLIQREKHDPWKRHTPDNRCRYLASGPSGHQRFAPP